MGASGFGVAPVDGIVMNVLVVEISVSLCSCSWSKMLVAFLNQTKKNQVAISPYQGSYFVEELQTKYYCNINNACRIHSFI